MIANVRRRYWVLYPLWIAICAGLFIALQHRPDPSRPSGRILSNDAGVRALAILQKSDATRYSGYEAVHVAYAGRGEGGAVARWVVLMDTALVENIRLARTAPLMQPATWAGGRPGRVARAGRRTRRPRRIRRG